MPVRIIREYNAAEFALNRYDAIIVGSGFAGSVLARELAERAGKRVAILEQRSHIGGNAYDQYDETGVLVHRFGPHIFHTNDQRVFRYLSRFTEWYDYQHQVLADIYGCYTPVPFNLNSIEQHFTAEKATQITEKLLSTFGADTKVPIIELKAQDDPLLAELADFVYQNVFLHYTEKQWDLTPEQIDPSVTARVPVLVGRDNRYFQDKYQGMPLHGYTALFEHLLDHQNIDCYLNYDARDAIELVMQADSLVADTPYNGIKINGAAFAGTLIYTGALDLLSGLRFGLLPYRSLDFVYKSLPVKRALPCGTVNYTVSEEYTRVTEYPWLTGQDLDRTTIMEEYSQAFSDPDKQIPYYAIINTENNQRYQRYLALYRNLPQFHAVGRLAEYRYYNMDQIIARALELADSLC